ncbi:MAG: ATP-binding protein [Oscillospiraceae bacterium]|nr:ATP-binding protein [Oscillospiraceae bacterium]
MLLQFSVDNYLSFKDPAVLSLVPAADKEHSNNITGRGDFKGLNTIAIYGANASGKSNLFKAVTVALNMIRNSANTQVDQMLPVVPFKLDDESKDKPSAFEFQFVADDEKKYIYGFSAFPDKIVEEYLYCYNTNRPTKVFDRTETDSYTFSRTTKKELDPIVRFTTKNRLFISSATLLNAESTRSAYEWLSKGIDTYMNVQELEGHAFAYYKADHDNNSIANIEFTKELFKAADISISDISYNYHKFSEFAPDVPNIKINNEPVFSEDTVMHEVKTEHIVTDENGDVKKYSLSLAEESLGTTMLFFYGPFIKETLDKGKVLFIDEIDKSLHPFIVSYLINLFSSSRNKGAQLIVTTHDTSQLSLERFRRDQIYFTEKNPKTGASDLYSLDDFEKPVRKDENIRKKYLQGRYGAIPYVHAEDLL